LADYRFFGLHSNSLVTFPVGSGLLPWSCAVWPFQATVRETMKSTPA
jgi:hypothetical protein